MNFENISNAIKLASEAHENDRWGDYTYTVHLALTATRVQELINVPGSESNLVDTDEAIAAAWLHDVIEDHPVYENRIAASFPNLVDSLRLVSRNEGDSYAEFIQSIIDSRDPLALAVKISDMYVNMSNNPRKSLLNRYQKNYDLLMNAWINIHQ